jgi:hypothetical protein
MASYSKRERYIAIVTVAVVAIWGLDRFIVSPLFTRQQDLSARIRKASDENDKATRVIRQARIDSRDWRDIAGTKLQPDASTAESQVLHRMTTWAQESRLDLTALRPDRSDQEKGLNKISFRATANGNMSQISRFLWHVQTSDIPIRITDYQITTRKEGTDELALALGVATIYPMADTALPAPNRPEVKR